MKMQTCSSALFARMSPMLCVVACLLFAPCRQSNAQEPKTTSPAPSSVEKAAPTTTKPNVWHTAQTDAQAGNPVTKAWREAWRKKWAAKHAKEQNAAKAQQKQQEVKAQKQQEAKHKAAAASTSEAKPAPAVPAVNLLKSTAPATSAASPGARSAASGVSATDPVPDAKSSPSGTAHPFADSLRDTRPDPNTTLPAKNADRPLESPMSAVGDGGRMFLFLLPVVLLMVGALHLVKKFQEKQGKSPAFAKQAAHLPGRKAPRTAPKTGGLWKRLVAGMNLQRAQERGGSNIRLIESVPLGGSNVHLIEVRGRILLVGANGNNVSLLTEFEEPQGFENSDFRMLLQEAANSMDDLDLPAADAHAALLAGGLDDEMRDTSSAIVNTRRRLRTVQEAEDAWIQEDK